MTGISIFNSNWTLPQSGLAQTDGDRAQAIIRVRCATYFFKVATSPNRALYLDSGASRLAQLVPADQVRLIETFNRGVAYLGLGEFQVPTKINSQTADLMERGAMAFANHLDLAQIFGRRRVHFSLLEAVDHYQVGAGQEKSLKLDELCGAHNGVTQGTNWSHLLVIGLASALGGAFALCYRSALQSLLAKTQQISG